MTFSRRQLAWSSSAKMPGKIHRNGTSIMRGLAPALRPRLIRCFTRLSASPGRATTARSKWRSSRLGSETLARCANPMGEMRSATAASASYSQRAAATRTAFGQRSPCAKRSKNSATRRLLTPWQSDSTISAELIGVMLAAGKNESSLPCIASGRSRLRSSGRSRHDFSRESRKLTTGMPHGMTMMRIFKGDCLLIEAFTSPTPSPFEQS